MDIVLPLATAVRAPSPVGYPCERSGPNPLRFHVPPRRRKSSSRWRSARALGPSRCFRRPGPIHKQRVGPPFLGPRMFVSPRGHCFVCRSLSCPGRFDSGVPLPYMYAVASSTVRVSCLC
jgi:hypothetical protein